MTAPASAFLAPGTVLTGRYEILRELGRGGYSVVYLARDCSVGVEVAVKLLVPPPAAAQLARERMRREVQAVRGLSHANIVAVFDFVEDGPWSFIVMEYVAGPDLQVRVRERGPLEPGQAVQVGRDVAAALTTAHRRGILHRDVKPPNVLLEPDGRARLTDFGSAKLDGQLGVTGTGALAGTLAYTSPEVLVGRRGDARADIYALGLSLYFALTGSFPESSSPHLPPTPQDDGYHPRLVSPGVPHWLDGVIARATTSAAENRFPTAAAFGEALVAGGVSPTMSHDEAGACMLCGGPDPLSLGICPACGGSPDVADTLVFLDPAPTASGRRAAALRLAIVMPDLRGPDRAAAARGERPLFRVAAASASRLMEELQRRELPSRSVAPARAWAAFPTGFWMLLAAVVVAGGTAGLAVAPSLLATTPMVGALLVLGARRASRTPLVVPPHRRSGLPSAVENEVVRTLSELPPGTARSLLSDLVRMCAALGARLERTGDDRGLTPQLADLLAAACAAATDLWQLDENLGRFERQRDRLAGLPEGWLDTLARCERTRDALVQRLLEAMTVAGRLQGQQAAFAVATDDSLADLTRELRLEGEAQGAAAKDIAALFARRG